MSGYRTYTFAVTVSVHDSFPEDHAMQSVESLRAEIVDLAMGDVTVIAAGPAFDVATSTTIVSDTFRSKDV